MNRLKYFLMNGLLLTVVTLILRTVGVSFNVYLSNKIGAAAMGLLGLISTVYNFGITLATSGINLATTRLISEHLGNKKGENKFGLKSIMRQSLGYAAFFGIFAAFLLFMLSDTIGIKILGDIRTIKPLKFLAVTLPFISISSALNGYFTAVRKVYKNAITQILNQFLRISACVFLFTVFSSDNVESACMAIVIGGVISELTAFFVQCFLYLFDNVDRSKHNTKFVNKKIRNKILKITLPVAFSAYIRSGLVTLEHLLVPWGLKKSGNTGEQSLASYGTVQSMAFPLVLFPSAISSSFAGLLIPEMAESNAMKDTKRIQRIAEKVFKSILIFSIGTAGLIMCFSYELGSTFYPNTDAARYILLIAPLIPVMYIDTSVDSMLKGLGKQTYTMLINVIDATLSVILVVILLPKFGIYGFIITVYFTEIINATLSITYLLCICKINVKIFDWIVKPLVCIIGATYIMRLFLTTLGIFSTSRVETLWHIFMGSFIYLLFLILIRAIKIKK